MSNLEILTLVTVPVLIAIAALLSAAETVLTRMSGARADSLAVPRADESDERIVDERALILAALLKDRVRSLAPVLLVFVFALIGAATLVAMVAHDRLGGFGVAVAFLVEVFVLYGLVFLGPRASALTRLDRVGLSVAKLVRRLGASPVGFLVAPMVRLAGVFTNGDEKTFKASPVSERELLAMTGQAAADASIDPEEQELIKSVLKFGDTKVRRVMVPRPDMVTVASAATVRDGLALVVEHGFSRFPVVGDGIDDINGVVHAKDLLAADLAGKGGDLISARMRSTHHVPETKQISKLQREMQQETFHIAIVVDEYGGTAGLVTLEDLLEELVGEIVDEFDVEEPMIELLENGARVNGKVSLSELEDLVGERLPDGDWSTVGGLIFSTLGHVPAEGEEIELPNHRLIVERVQGRRIARVHMSRLVSTR